MTSEELKEREAAELMKMGMPEEAAKATAAADVDRMGITKIENGTCPMGRKLSIACTFCPYGHLTECHHPHTCEEAECSHYQRSY